MFIFIILPIPTLSRGFHKSRAGWKLWLSQGRRNRDTGLILPRVLFFLLLWTRKQPRLQAKNLESRAVFIRCSVLFSRGSKSRKANFYYSSSMVGGCLLFALVVFYSFQCLYFLYFLGSRWLLGASVTWVLLRCYFQAPPNPAPQGSGSQPR